MPDPGDAHAERLLDLRIDHAGGAWQPPFQPAERDVEIYREQAHGHGDARTHAQPGKLDPLLSTPALQRCEISARSANALAPLDDEAGFGRVAQKVFGRSECEGERGPRRRSGDGAAGAWAARDQAGVAQAAQRLARGVAAHAVSTTELGFGRQRIADGDAARCNARFERLRDALVAVLLH